MFIASAPGHELHIFLYFKPFDNFQVDLYLIPVPNANTELISNSTVAFKTKAPLQGKQKCLRYNDDQEFRNVRLERQVVRPCIPNFKPNI